MRVAFHVDQLWFSAPGGIGTYVWELGSALPREDPSLELALFRSRWRHAPPRMWLASEEPVEVPWSIRVLYPAWDLLGRPSLPRALDRCDVVHATNHAAVPPARPGQRLVVTVHDLAFERFPDAFPRTWRRLYAAGVRAAARRADVILTPSRATADDLLAGHGVDPARVRVTPLAASLPEHPAVGPEALERAGVDRPYVLCPGTLEPRKNHARLVRAYRRVAARLPHALVLAGPAGWQLEELERELARAGPGRVVRTGPLDEDVLDAVYRAADLVVYPSLYEGFGLPVLEAMVRGVPVVASTTPAVAETAGDAALLVDPTDVDALAGAIERALTDPGLAGDLSRRGRDRAGAFSWRRTARETIAAYRLPVAGGEG